LDIITWTLLLNRVSRVKLCLISVIPDIDKHCPKIRNLPKIFLRSFENVSPAANGHPVSRLRRWRHNYMYSLPLTLQKCVR